MMHGNPCLVQAAHLEASAMAFLGSADFVTRQRVPGSVWRRCATHPGNGGRVSALRRQCGPDPAAHAADALETPAVLMQKRLPATQAGSAADAWQAPAVLMLSGASCHAGLGARPSAGAGSPAARAQAGACGGERGGQAGSHAHRDGRRVGAHHAALSGAVGWIESFLVLPCRPAALVGALTATMGQVFAVWRITMFLDSGLCSIQGSTAFAQAAQCTTP